MSTFNLQKISQTINSCLMQKTLSFLDSLNPISFIDITFTKVSLQSSILVTNIHLICMVNTTMPHSFDRTITSDNITLRTALSTPYPLTIASLISSLYNERSFLKLPHCLQSMKQTLYHPNQH